MVAVFNRGMRRLLATDRFGVSTSSAVAVVDQRRRGAPVAPNPLVAPLRPHFSTTGVYILDAGCRVEVIFVLSKTVTLSPKLGSVVITTLAPSSPK